MQQVYFSSTNTEGGTQSRDRLVLIHPMEFREQWDAWGKRIRLTIKKTLTFPHYPRERQKKKPLSSLHFLQAHNTSITSGALTKMQFGNSQGLKHGNDRVTL